MEVLDTNTRVLATVDDVELFLYVVGVDVDPYYGVRYKLSKRPYDGMGLCLIDSFTVMLNEDEIKEVLK